MFNKCISSRNEHCEILEKVWIPLIFIFMESHFSDLDYPYPGCLMCRLPQDHPCVCRYIRYIHIIYFLIPDDPEWSGVEFVVNEGELTQRHTWVATVTWWRSWDGNPTRSVRLHQISPRLWELLRWHKGHRSGVTWNSHPWHKIPRLVLTSVYRKKQLFLSHVV